MNSLKGLGVALVTPFKEDLSIDFEGLSNILEHLYNAAALDYLVVLGSTGEAATLHIEEKQKILSFVKDFNKNRLPLVFGHSGNNTVSLIRSLEDVDSTGYAAILSASPAYVRPTQTGIIAHYQQLADNSSLPILLYNVPSRTGSNITATTTLELAKHRNIIGIKEASGDLMQAIEINSLKNDDFLLISGDDQLTVPLFSVGAVGLISVLANAYPKQFKEIINHCQHNEFLQAAEISGTMLEINELMYKEGNPTGVKQLLAHLGLCRPFVRLPMMKATDELSKDIQHTRLD